MEKVAERKESNTRGTVLRQRLTLWCAKPASASPSTLQSAISNDMRDSGTASDHWPRRPFPSSHREEQRSVILPLEVGIECETCEESVKHFVTPTLTARRGPIRGRSGRDASLVCLKTLLTLNGSL